MPRRSVPPPAAPASDLRSRVEERVEEPGAATRRVLGPLEPVESAVDPHDPSRGARRREGFLLAAYAILFLIGVWTVAASELAPSEPSSRSPGGVTQATQTPSPSSP